MTITTGRFQELKWIKLKVVFTNWITNIQISFMDLSEVVSLKVMMKDQAWKTIKIGLDNIKMMLRIKD